MKKLIWIFVISCSAIVFIYAFPKLYKNECIYCNNGEFLDLSPAAFTELSNTATCSQGGIRVAQCSHCSRKVEHEVSPLDHDFRVSKNESDCSNSGNVYYTCQRKDCNETKIEWSEADPSNHKYVKTYSHETITYEYAEYRCSICNVSKTENNKVNMGSSIKNTEEWFYYATGAAKRIVKEELKYPSSSRFLDESKMEVHFNHVTGFYYIEGAVSAPNAVGVYSDFYFIVKTKIAVIGDKIKWSDYDCELQEG